MTLYFWESIAFTVFLNLQKKAKDHLGIDGDENSMMYEDNVQPAK